MSGGKEHSTGSVAATNTGDIAQLVGRMVLSFVLLSHCTFMILIKVAIVSYLLMTMRMVRSSKDSESVNNHKKTGHLNLLEYSITSHTFETLNRLGWKNELKCYLVVILRWYQIWDSTKFKLCFFAITNFWRKSQTEELKDLAGYYKWLVLKLLTYKKSYAFRFCCKYFVFHIHIGCVYIFTIFKKKITITCWFLKQCPKCCTQLSITADINWQ